MNALRTLAVWFGLAVGGWALMLLVLWSMYEMVRGIVP